MSLSQFEPITETIIVKARSGEIKIPLRGLGFSDLSSLIRLHYNDLEAMFDLYEHEARMGGFTNIAVARYATALIKDAPGLVSHIIALAADEPEMTDKAASLPMTAQIDALAAIGRLTFEEIGSVKKLMEQAANLMADMKGNPPPQ